MSLRCIVCGRDLSDALPLSRGENQPYGGTAFMTQGHYGSTVFDEMDGSYLEINVCDPCLTAAARKRMVNHARYGQRAAKAWKPQGHARAESDTIVTLQDRVRVLEEALVQAAVPLEALRTCICLDPTFPLAPTSRHEIINGVACIRAALTQSETLSQKGGE